MSAKDKFSIQLKDNNAFLAKTVFDLHSLIQAQSDELYLEKNMGFPVSVSSTLMFLSQYSNVTTMQVATALNITHQLVSQRIKMLLKLGLIEGKADENDRRKTLYSLTATGQQKVQVLNLYCIDAANAFSSLSEEVGINLQSVLNAAIDALRKTPFGKRFPTNSSSYDEQLSKP
ncbi:MarR family winged helix-turn-helix transcriptional regulator [Alteromonas gracilis]|uniref:MarR family winged helix-turn-helix transcriptional regulator n=1 Tax=Alteromonas gracilis TaxID=1479524 RepID=UPI003736795A